MDLLWVLKLHVATDFGVQAFGGKLLAEQEADVVLARFSGILEIHRPVSPEKVIVVQGVQLWVNRSMSLRLVRPISVLHVPSEGLSP
jgi:predicted N-formylglutamate amidohydrolase